VKRRIPILVTLLAAMLVLGQCAAADSPFVVDTWSTADGLPQSSVIAITQTRDGYLWLGTLNGLVRFDGNSLTPFDINNTTNLPNNGIVFLFEDSRTNLWAGTLNAGLCQISNGVVRSFPVGTGAGNVAAAFETPDGAVWFATSGLKYFCWRHGAMDWKPQMDTDFGLFMQFLAFHLLVPDKQGGSWQMWRGRVERFLHDGSEKYSPLCPWGQTLVTAACQDDAGNLVVATRGKGVYWFDAKGDFRRLSKNDGLSEDYVLSLCIDSEHNLWVGTDGGGLDRVKRKSFSPQAELEGEGVLSAADDQSGGLWASVNLHGLTYLNSNLMQHFSIGQESEPGESKPGPVLVDGRQRVWAGTLGEGEGLFQLMGGNFEPVPAARPAGPQIYALLAARDGIVWAGGKNGLAGFDGTNWQIYTAADGLAPSPVRALADDDQGNLWIGTGGGLFVLRDHKISPVASPVTDLTCLLMDPSGVLWAGTAAHGLARRQNGVWTVITKADGLINDIGYLIEDGQGNLWIGSYEGLMRATQSSLADFAAGRTRKISCRTYLSRECSADVQPAAMRSANGRLWFPTAEGLVSVNPAELTPNTHQPPVVIESVLVDGVELKTNLLGSDWNGTVALTPANEHLEIHFASLNFSAPKGMAFGARFRYRLEEPVPPGGAKPEPGKSWTDIGTERVAHFQKLQPGEYAFHVQACNEDGVWNLRFGVSRASSPPLF